jgi:hypothetical protein
MDGKFDEAELLFIQEVLDQHGEYLVDLMHDEIERKNLRVTDDLLDSINYKVTHYGIDPVLQVSFFSYGRAIEIRWHKRSSNTRNWTTDTNKEVWGTNRKTRKKKNTLFYARNVYGSQNRLISMISNDYTEEEKIRIRNILHQTKVRLAV